MTRHLCLRLWTTAAFFGMVWHDKSPKQRRTLQRNYDLQPQRLQNLQRFCITTTPTILITAANFCDTLLASSPPSCSAGPQALIRRRVVRLRALVLLPSRDLAMQVHSVFKKYARGTGLRVGLAIGQTNFLEEQLALVGPVALAGDACLHRTGTAVVASATVVVVARFVTCRSCG